MEYEYTPELGGAAGAIVMVHPYQSMPFPEEQGVIVQPGLQSTIAIRKVGLFLPQEYITAFITG